MFGFAYDPASDIKLMRVIDVKKKLFGKDEIKISYINYYDNN